MNRSSFAVIVVYAIVAGPVNFAWGARERTPSWGLIRLGVLAFVTFAALLMLGGPELGGGT